MGCLYRDDRCVSSTSQDCQKVAGFNVPRPQKRRSEIRVAPSLVVLTPHDDTCCARGWSLCGTVPRAQVTLGEFPGTGDRTIISQGNCCRPSRCTSRALVANPVDTWPKFRVIWTLQEATLMTFVVGSHGAFYPLDISKSPTSKEDTTPRSHARPSSDPRDRRTRAVAKWRCRPRRE